MTPSCMGVPQGPHRWGTRGRKYNSPLPDDICAGCHRRYDEIGIAEHIVDPNQWPTQKANESA